MGILILKESGIALIYLVYAARSYNNWIFKDILRWNLVCGTTNYKCSNYKYKNNKIPDDLSFSLDLSPLITTSTCIFSLKCPNLHVYVPASLSVACLILKEVYKWSLTAFLSMLIPCVSDSSSNLCPLRYHFMWLNLTFSSDWHFNLIGSFRLTVNFLCLAVTLALI